MTEEGENKETSNTDSNKEEDVVLDESTCSVTAENTGINNRVDESTDQQQTSSAAPAAAETTIPENNNNNNSDDNVGEDNTSTSEKGEEIIRMVDSSVPKEETINNSKESPEDAIPAEQEAVTCLSENTKHRNNNTTDSTNAIPPTVSSPEEEEETTTEKSSKPATASVTATANTTNSKKAKPLTLDGLKGLPMDALHGIASFMTPPEWCNGLGLVNKSFHTQCSEIVRRVRMHAFKCSTEVITCWKLGQHEDSHELAALYCQAGVPLYSCRSLGHSYHTLQWRMKVESREMANAANTAETGTDDNPVEDRNNNNNADRPPGQADDPFFGTGRTEFRANEGYGRELTYLEEKCLFYVGRSGATTGADGGFVRGNAAANRTARTSRSPTSRQMILNSPTGAASATSASKKETPNNKRQIPKVPVPIHQHLLDQHRHGEYFVNDKDGRMVTPMISLSADFFHPRFAAAGAATTTSRMNNNTQSTRFELEEQQEQIDNNNNNNEEQQQQEEDDELLLSNNSLSLLYDDGEAVEEPPVVVPPPPSTQDQVPTANDNDDNVENNNANNNNDDGAGDGDDDVELFAPPPSPVTTSVLGSVELEVYSSSLTTGAVSLKTEDPGDTQEVRRHLRSRFSTYQRRLETFLGKGDNLGFDECMLDFWDEFFPHTAGIHYHDMETAVPRLSNLQKFLTKPCPKAIGVVQCEIERIKISNRGKGVNVKGRLFPTYEYRLFIRNRPHNTIGDSPESASTAETDDFVRRDTVLMVAKNRGRRHAESNGGMVPMSLTSKKGSNNYYLYMPQQMDVDTHFNKVNGNDGNPARFVPNGSSFNPVLVSDDAGSSLLGRLQSNFIGTEFQIFTPRLRKLPRRKAEPSASQPFCSEDELDYDSGMSSDNSNFRRSRFGRLTLRRGTNAGTSSDISTGSYNELESVSERRPVHRTMSSPEISGGRQTRTNRRAIANDAHQKTPKAVLCEEEDGAITYTANLLGSRPRIMDVCIPKVTAEGIARAEWQRYLSTCDDTDDCRMLSCFRQLLQQRENLEQNPNNADNDDESDAPEDTDFGLLALQNRPPWWNVELGSFVLNFGGRVSVASVKNFQLCERTNQDLIMLQFGRIKGRHSFTMDFQHPLTAVQAFSIAISSLQSKISFG